jgi:hypothetical protein
LTEYRSGYLAAVREEEVIRASISRRGLHLVTGGASLAQSNGGVHAHVAPAAAGGPDLHDAGVPSTGTPTFPYHPQRSPALDLPDGQWNNGEGAFSPSPNDIVDFGGFFGMNIGPAVLGATCTSSSRRAAARCMAG